MDTRTPGQRAYEAFWHKMDPQVFTREPMQCLPEGLRAGWEAGAAAVTAA